MSQNPQMDYGHVMSFRLAQLNTKMDHDATNKLSKFVKTTLADTIYFTYIVFVGI